MTTGKTIGLTRWTFVGKVMSLLFNMLSRLVMRGKSHGQRSLVGCSPWGCTEPDTTEATYQQQQQSVICIRWLKYWRFSFSISPFNEYSGLISFRIDCFDLLAVQGILKNFQHHSPKASMLQHSAFFMVQLSHPYMTTGKTIALTAC